MDNEQYEEMSEDEYMERKRRQRNCEEDEWGQPLPPWGAEK